MPASPPPDRPAHSRPALIALVVVAFVACLGLAWWQWERFESASGTGQNLGYALQWPLFAGFVIFAYFRFVRLERESREDESAGSPDTVASADAGASGEPSSARRRPSTPREIPAGILPERPAAARSDDPVLSEYNRYLAELNAAERGPARDSDRSAG